MRKLIALVFLTPAAGALAHDVEGQYTAADALSWGAEPWVLCLLALSLLLCALGLRTLLPRARGSRQQLLRQTLWFGLGWICLVLALASPVDLAGGFSFAAHMVQHELLMIVAAPLLVLGRPLGVWVWAFPAGWRRRIGNATRNGAVRAAWGSLTRPLNAWLLHFAALWMWHVPSSFQSALASNGMHALQHTCFLFSALLFWWAVLGKDGEHNARGSAIVYLFTTMMHTGALGALFTFSASVWYPMYGSRAQAFGLTALEDQQLGGLIMWVPGGLAYVAAGLVLCARWLAQAPRSTTTGLGTNR
ncbi:MAG: cytochrome c oxidase assembly protein [Ramlibacter sp.]